MTNQENQHIEAVPEPDQGFFGLGIAPRILSILERLKFSVPTPIQRKTIPLALEGKDIIGIAQTGTGKTHAFAIPMIQHLAKQEGLALVLAPTRELAQQIDEAVKILAQPFGMKTACLIGGAPSRPQEEALRRRPNIIIATPGRLIDHMEHGRILLPRVNLLVIDEADRMFDMGFAPQVDRILSGLKRERQTLLFSATMPPEIVRMINTHMKLPVHVEIAPAGTLTTQVSQELYIVKREAKGDLLEKLLAQYHGTVLIFSRTKHGARKIARSVRNLNYRAAEIHSDRTMPQRKEALDGFKSGRYRILVATDIASRGIDVSKIELVINYDLPADIENYVHRIGRTGRAGNKGHAISFATPDQRSDVKSIERLIRMQLPIAKHPEVPSEEFDSSSQPASRPAPYGRRSGGGFHSNPGGKSSPAASGSRRFGSSYQRRRSS